MGRKTVPVKEHRRKTRDGKTTVKRHMRNISGKSKKGVNKNTLNRNVECPDCKGTGVINKGANKLGIGALAQCPRCVGTGEIDSEKGYGTRKIGNSRKLAVLNSDEEDMWNYLMTYYLNEGYSDKKADEMAWKELRKEYPRLENYDGIDNEKTIRESDIYD